jgi:hypothetical protein
MIPASGYIPRYTSQIMATVSENGRTKFRFQVTLQDVQENKLGD